MHPRQRYASVSALARRHAWTYTGTAIQSHATAPARTAKFARWLHVVNSKGSDESATAGAPTTIVNTNVVCMTHP